MVWSDPCSPPPFCPQPLLHSTTGALAIDALGGDFPMLARNMLHPSSSPPPPKHTL
jgi:hypothetical protein